MTNEQSHTPRVALVTGGAGFIGSHLVRIALDEGIAWQNAEIQKAEASLVDTFKKGGVTVIEPNVAAFRKATLAVLTIAGLNLIRRGLVG